MKIVSWLTVMFLASSAVSASTGPTVERPTIRLLSTHYPPFVMCDTQNNATDGLDNRILNAAFEKAQIKLEVYCAPWRRSLHEVAAGHYDGVFPLYINDERSKWGEFIMSPLHYESFIIASRKHDDKPIEKFSDLFEQTIGLNSGFYINQTFQEALENKRFRLKELNNTQSGLKALQRNRLNHYLSNITTLGYAATKMGIADEIKIEERRLTLPKPTYLSLSKQSPTAMRLAPKIKEALKLMRKSGELIDINNQYLDNELKMDDLYCPQHLEAVTIDW